MIRGRRIVQLLVLVALARFGTVAVRADMTCRDACFYSYGACQDAGDRWDYACDSIDPSYTGICDLDAYCCHSGC
jgi:hypothetical protein